jgi:predicted extracellular nuclease
MEKLRITMLFWLVAVWAPMTVSLRAVSTTVVISEFRVRGPSGGNDEFVELHNLSASPVNISGWAIRGSNNAGTNSVRHTVGANVMLNPGCFYLAVNNAAGGYSGAVPGDGTYGVGITDDGGIALTLPDGTIVDQAGMSNGSVYKEGTPLASLGSANMNRGYERTSGGDGGFVDTDDNSNDFQVLAPSNPQSTGSACLVAGALSIAGAATPNPAIQFETVRITGAVTPGLGPASTGITAAANLSAIGGLAAQPLFDDGSSGDLTANDNIYSYELPVNVGQGSYSVAVQVSDAQSRADTDTFTVVVEPPPIIYLPHEIQGDGPTSPHVGTTVTVEGVVTARRSNGVFLQTAVGQDDGNPATSEGLFVFTGGAAPAGAAVGTLVRATGRVTEFDGDGAGFTQTELGGGGSPTPTFTFHDAADLPAATPLTAANLSPDGPVSQLEPLENMLVFISSLTTVSGTDGLFASATGGESTGIVTSDGVFFAVLTGTPRPVRDPGLDLPIAATFANQCASGPPCSIPVFDSNPERLRVDSDAIGGPLRNLTSGVVITDLTGILDSGFLTWGLLPVPSSPGTAGPNAPPNGVPAAGPTQFTVASFNMQRFLDDQNDPLVDETVLAPANFANRIAKASLVIRKALNLPDIIAVQEVEHLSTLQAIADRVNADAGLANGYSAFLEEGNDPGGIDVGFLVRSRVHVTSVVQEGKNATFIDPSDASIDLLNDRPPLVLRATVDGPPNRLGASIIVVVNHLRSLIDVETQARVRVKRQKQAEFLADLLDRLQDEGPPVISVGDYNAFEFSDGLVDVLGTVRGDTAPPDTVVVASSDLVEPDFAIAAPGEYSFVFNGSAQVLDHVLLSSAAVDLFAGLRHARINADFPEILRPNPARAERLSDHDPAVAYFEFPLDTEPAAVAATPSVDTLGPPGHQLIALELAIEATDNLGVDECRIADVTSNEPINGTGDGDSSPDWFIDGPSSLRLRAERGGGSGRIYTIIVECVDVAGNVGSATAQVTVPEARK